ncbi:hypothetical protein AB5I41_27385 [Sphingomonas sp. MMS24-JH45]
MTPMEGITAPPAAPPRRLDWRPSSPTTTPFLASRRQDGWTAAAQRTLLEGIAEGHGVEVACARVGPLCLLRLRLSPHCQGRRLGARLAATLVARDAIADFCSSARSTVRYNTVIRGDTVVTRHRHDNRLAMSLFARLDRQVGGRARSRREGRAPRRAGVRRLPRSRRARRRPSPRRPVPRAPLRHAAEGRRPRHRRFRADPRARRGGSLPPHRSRHRGRGRHRRPGCRRAA